MKNLLFLFALLIAGTASAQKINWMSMNDALAAQKKAPKKIFMDVYTVWCGPCKMLDANTFTDKNVIDFINKNYYAVKFNAEGTEQIKHLDATYGNPEYQEGLKGRNARHSFAQAMNVTAYPSLAFFDTDGKLIQAIPGYRSPKELEIFLKMIASNDYKEITTAEKWKEYQEKFKGTF